MLASVRVLVLSQPGVQVPGPGTLALSFLLPIGLAFQKLCLHFPFSGTFMLKARHAHMQKPRGANVHNQI